MIVYEARELSIIIIPNLFNTNTNEKLDKTNIKYHV